MLLKVRSGSTWHLFDRVEDATYVYCSRPLTQSEDPNEDMLADHKEEIREIQRELDESVDRNLCQGLHVNPEHYSWIKVIFKRRHDTWVQEFSFAYDDSMFIMNDIGQNIETVRCPN